MGRSGRNEFRSWWSGEAKCPYWRGESGSERREVLCSGLQPGQTMRVHFRSEEKRKTWMRGYCCSYDFGACGICRAIEKNLEKEG